MEKGGLEIAIAGDTHGNEDLLFIELDEWEKRNNKKIDLLLLVGDLDTVIKVYDDCQTETRSSLADFRYGKKKAPYPIIFVAGNMDEWTILEPYKNGGKIVLNRKSSNSIYFLGRSGFKTFNGIKIGGLSGVYDPDEYEKPLPDEPNLWWRYYRENELRKLMGKKLDILLLHEWIKPHSAITVKVKEGISRHYTNNQPNHLDKLVKSIQPKYVFMGHRHTSYIEGTIGKSKVYGLMKVTKENLSLGYAYKVISMQPSI